jgi:hypothetical protein
VSGSSPVPFDFWYFEGMQPEKDNPQEEGNKSPATL